MNKENIQAETSKVETSKTNSKDFVSKPCCDKDTREENIQINEQKVELVLYELDESVESPWFTVNEEHIQAETTKVETLTTDSKEFASKLRCEEDRKL